MKTKILLICAMLAMLQALAVGQKTEITVKEGKVVAQNAAAAVTIEAGQKAMLAPNSNPALTVDNPLVDDIMKIYRWVQEEKNADMINIDSVSIQTHSFESDSLLTIAGFSEIPNPKKEPSDVLKLGPGVILNDPHYYDMHGNLLSFDLEKANESYGSFHHLSYYHLYFPQKVDPGDFFKVITVASKCSTGGAIWKEGPLWHIRFGNTSKNHLNYFRVILPESAIFVDSSHPISLTDSFNGRVALTFRIYTGTDDIGMYHIAFLWPDKDGTTLLDVPPQYRGLKDRRDESFLEDFIKEKNLDVAKIIAGEPFEDRTSPLTTILSLYSAAVNKNTDLLIDLIGNPQIKAYAVQNIDTVLSQGRHFLDMYEFLDTEKWSESPEDGDIHPVHFYRKGSQLRELTMRLIYKEGKWYYQDVIFAGPTADSANDTNIKTSGGVTLSKDDANLKSATYEGLEPGRFMKKWLFLGPIHVPWAGEDYFPDETAQKKFFKTEVLSPEKFDPTVRFENKDYQWVRLNSEYGIIDLTSLFETWYVGAYAWAQIDMPAETTGTLGIGSDDNIKVWLNGKLVHEHWEQIGRGVYADNDRVPVTFRKGKNQLVLKIQNGGGPWGFCCRLLDE